MPVSTLSAALHITPVVLATLVAHGKRRAQKLKNGDKPEAKDDLFFDQAFNIVRSFLDMTVKNTVESTQQFMNTHIPAPYWAAVSPVIVPFQSCNRAADALIDWFGPKELHAVGGERWWQVRGLDGIDAEWITEKEFLNEDDHDIPQGLSIEDANILKMEHLETVMLYIHGGGYFWGSINTHRYQIIRYARKMRGRAFAVNYRKAPQYPWPCPLQDVLAAYLYLIEPPQDSLHKPVSPSKIVLAGDSAGGGLCLTLLTILRDLGLPMPAGAVLISPWVDLTHSFPSVMKNTNGDIIPNHGFISKPSTLWPVDLQAPEGGRVVQTATGIPPKPGDTDTLKPSQDRIREDEQPLRPESVHAETQRQMLIEAGSDENVQQGQVSESQSLNSDEVEDIDKWEPKPPKVLMNDPDAVPLELRSQIQLYATMEQLTHPLVSPILQGSLGNLPPLYIIAGQEEVLRDEIIYLAHRAAYPDKYTARRGALLGHRQKENAERFTIPTKVHLQVFDGMCHVLTVFSFTQSAKYAYRAIAEFAKHVTAAKPDAVNQNTFPTLKLTPSHLSDAVDLAEHKGDSNPNNEENDATDSRNVNGNAAASSDIEDSSNDNHDEHEFDEKKFVNGDGKGNISASSPELDEVVDNARDRQDVSSKVQVVRERVDIFGQVRPMEPDEEIECLRIPAAQIGLIKEAPTRRWQEGQERWDRKYKGAAKRAMKKRRKIEAKTEKLLSHAREEGLVLRRELTHSTVGSDNRGIPVDTKGVIQQDRRWGPLDLDDERPPPSAIAGRRDTPEAYALIKKHVFHTAPRTHRTIPTVKAGDIIKAMFDPEDEPIHAPQQSASEQQVRNIMLPVHGLKMWDSIITYFMRKSSRKALRGKDQAVSAIKDTGTVLISALTPSDTKSQ